MGTEPSLGPGPRKLTKSTQGRDNPITPMTSVPAVMWIVAAHSVIQKGSNMNDYRQWKAGKVRRNPWVEFIICGSIRRCKEQVRDVDLVAVVPKHGGKEEKAILNRFGMLLDFTEPRFQKNRKLVTRGKYKGISFDLNIADPMEKATMVCYATGSGFLNVLMRSLAKRNGMKLSQYGLFRVADGKRIPTKSEDAVFERIGMRSLHPTERNK